VLVEHPDEAAGLAIASGLRFAGYAVAVCPGPSGQGRCPLMGPEGCAPAHDADLVVCCLGYEREAAREILRELRMRYPGVPLLVEASSDMDADLRESSTAATGYQHRQPPCRSWTRYRGCSAAPPRRTTAVRSPFW
jgi:hypothetical protein